MKVENNELDYRRERKSKNQQLNHEWECGILEAPKADGRREVREQKNAKETSLGLYNY